MNKGSSQIINKMNVTTKRPTINKSERNKIRAAVHECELKFKALKNTVEYKELFLSTVGRVMYMKRLHQQEVNKLLKRLELVKP